MFEKIRVNPLASVLIGFAACKLFGGGEWLLNKSYDGRRVEISPFRGGDFWKEAQISTGTTALVSAFGLGLDWMYRYKIEKTVFVKNSETNVIEEQRYLIDDLNSFRGAAANVALAIGNILLCSMAIMCNGEQPAGIHIVRSFSPNHNFSHFSFSSSDSIEVFIGLQCLLTGLAMVFDAFSNQNPVGTHLADAEHFCEEGYMKSLEPLYLAQTN